MNEYTHFSAKMNSFLHRLRSRPQDVPAANRYFRLSRDDIKGSPGSLWVKTTISWLSNYRTGKVDHRRLVARCRNYRSPRQVQRIARDDDRIKITGRGRGSEWFFLANHAARPVWSHLAFIMQTPEAARYLRFLLWAAWSRTPWESLTARQVARDLAVDTHDAAAFLRWLRSSEVTRGELRSLVFYTRRPAWWQYTRRGGNVAKKTPVNIGYKKSNQYPGRRRFAEPIARDRAHVPREGSGPPALADTPIDRRSLPESVGDWFARNVGRSGTDRGQQPCHPGKSEYSKQTRLPLVTDDQVKNLSVGELLAVALTDEQQEKIFGPKNFFFPKISNGLDKRKMFKRKQ